MSAAVKRICLWSGPRNVSTALMYSFAQRPDTTVVDEPLYAAYLAGTGVDHPGREETLRSQSTSVESVVADIILGPCPTPVLFLKSMAHHLHSVDAPFLDKLINVVLTRDPLEMLPSFAKQISRPTLRDTGLPQQLALVRALKSRGQQVPVLDSRRLLEAPDLELRALCDRVGIDFDERMLAWEAGARPEDGSWARYWYDSVHASTGFQPYRLKTEPFPASLRPLLDEARPIYLELVNYA